MRPAKLYVPKDTFELSDFVISMLLSAPKFIDKTGYFPHRNLDYVFRQLNEGLSHNRQALGEDRFHELMRMSGEIRALFEADPENETGETWKGREIILKMEDIVKQVQRKS
ncbi:MAG: hypothetical protein ABSF67_15100 [Roseiarcus sp.]